MARLKAEAKEKAYKWDYEDQLKVNHLKRAADKEVRIQQLELEAVSFRGSVVPPVTASEPVNVMSEGNTSLNPSVVTNRECDVMKVIYLIPQFYEAEGDAYFVAFE